MNKFINFFVVFGLLILAGVAIGYLNDAFQTQYFWVRHGIAFLGLLGAGFVMVGLSKKEDGNVHLALAWSGNALVLASVVFLLLAIKFIAGLEGALTVAGIGAIVAMMMCRDSRRERRQKLQVLR